MFNSSTSSPGLESPASKPKSRLTLTFRPKADELTSLASISSSATSPFTSYLAGLESPASKPKPRLILTFRSRVDEPTSLASSSGSAASPFSTYIAKSPTPMLKPFISYPTNREYPFDPLSKLISYCCEIDLTGAVDTSALERMLACMETGFKKYTAKRGRGADIIKDQVIGYLNFALISLDDVEENPLFNERIAAAQGLMCRLFSNALVSFLKHTRIEEPVDAGFLRRVDDSAPAPATVVAKKPKAFSESARRLLTSIRNNKLYEVQALLSAKPTLAIEGTKDLTVLSEAAYYGEVGILESIVAALNRLSDAGQLPSDYYGRLVGEDAEHVLPALLWAAVNGKLDALKYLYSIDGIKTSLQLVHIEEVIAEVLELDAEKAKKSTSYKDIAAFLQMMRRELLPVAQAKEHDVIATDGALAGVAASQISSLSKAIHAGDTEKVRTLLVADGRIAAQGNSKKSIFSDATCFGNLEIVELVMEKLPSDYNYGQFLGGQDLVTQQSAVLMAALAGKKDILIYLLSLPAVIASLAPREILSAIKKLEDFLEEKKDDKSLIEDYGWSFKRFGVSKYVYNDIYNFLYDFYFSKVARAEVPKVQREPFLACSVSGYGMMFTHTASVPLAGSKRGFAAITDTEKVHAAPNVRV